MVTVEDVRAVALTLPRSSMHVVRDRLKFRIGAIVWLAFSHDETSMGFAFPKEERDSLIAAEPHKFFLPPARDLRFNWVCGWLSAIDEQEMREIVLDAWRMCVPKRVARDFLGA